MRSVARFALLAIAGAAALLLLHWFVHLNPQGSAPLGAQFAPVALMHRMAAVGGGGETLLLVGYTISSLAGLVAVSLAFALLLRAHISRNAFVLGASLAYEMILLAGVLAAGGVFDLRGAFVDAVLPAAAVNLMLAPPVYLLMRLGRPSGARRPNTYSF